VHLEVLDHVGDTPTEQSNLDVGRARVRRVHSVLLDDLALYFLG
jgi:hypothetical protein